MASSAAQAHWAVLTFWREQRRWRRYAASWREQRRWRRYAASWREQRRWRRYAAPLKHSREVLRGFPERVSDTTAWNSPTVTHPNSSLT
jgi:hypothetical protein